MTNSLNLGDIDRRPLKYWNIDGLPELAMGVMWTIWGAWLMLESVLQDPRVVQRLTPAVLVVSAVGYTWAIKRVKERITFPRTGYIEMKPPSRTRYFAATVIAISVATLAAPLRMPSPVRFDSFFVPGMAIVIGVFLVVESVRQRARYLLAPAAIACVLGVVFAAMNVGPDAAKWFLISLGPTLALIGAIRLRLFLKRHPMEAGA